MMMANSSADRVVQFFERNPCLENIERSLTALGYPAKDSFDHEEPVELTKLVAWLEDRKIRLYSIEERTALRNPGPAWGSAFKKYLEDLECPQSYIHAEGRLEGSSLRGLRWLLHKAIAYEYEDKGSTYNARAAAVAAAHHLPPPPPGSDTREVVGAAGAAAATAGGGDPLAVVAELCRRCGVRQSEDLLSTLRMLHLAIKVKYGSLEELANDQKEDIQQRLNLDNFPLGFSTEDPLLDKAAKLLKMLYLTDLRNLQNSINDILVTAQEFTANPKTNTALGKVGR
uniref:Uncharacterized protein n=1 Tax=Heterosigma akashiwo TaxID=2829 RepID=A0A7S3Y2A7_HETAK|mmetsp:Transcript_29959/g.51991  ORF Transcript_29959/g.51991 Transcript_29959/m.51991 type:complete len:285 (+) Transcript_29959:43-897(+)